MNRRLCRHCHRVLQTWESGVCRPCFERESERLARDADGIRAREELEDMFDRLVRMYDREEGWR